MQWRQYLLIVSAMAAFLLSAQSQGQNPIVQTIFTADPAPMVYDGVVYLYTGHDEDDAHGFHMLNWHLYSTTDMVNWADRGVVASLATFPWAVQANGAWAPQVIPRNGKFYMYAPISVEGKPKHVIAVAVADKPWGPFKDALNRPLIDKANGYFDPTVFIDDDDQAYLYWGNPNLWYVKLNKDMISYSGDIMKWQLRLNTYQEGPWFYKRNGRYYMAFASHCCPEGIGYAMSDGPTGPWEYKGSIMDGDPRSSGNHPGIIDYKGSSYIFGFNYALNYSLTDQHRERRSVTIARFEYNNDGTISKLPWWESAGVSQVGTLNPYQRTEAETINWESGPTSGFWAPGVKTAQNDRVGVYVTDISDGDYIRVRGVDFGDRGASTFTARVASGSKGGEIDVHLDSVDGPQVSELHVPHTGGWDKWRTKSATTSNVSGVHDVYFVFKGARDTKLLNFDYWEFESKDGGR